MAEAGTAPASRQSDGAMAEARKRLRGAGRVIESHHAARLRLEASRQAGAAQTLFRLGKLKERPKRSQRPVAEKSSLNILGDAVIPKQAEVWGDLSNLRHGTPHDAPGRLTTPDLGFNEVDRLQRLQLASRQQNFRPSAAGGDPAGRDAVSRPLREEVRSRESTILAEHEVTLGRKGLLPRAGLRRRASHRNLSTLQRDKHGYQERARRTLGNTTLDEAWRREQADLAVESRKGDDDTMILPGDDMSLASFWWSEQPGATQSGREQSQMLVDVSHARKPAPSQLYTLRPLPTQSELNKSRKSPKAVSKSTSAPNVVSSYDAAGASVALPRQDKMTQIRRIQIRNEQRKATLSRSYYPRPKSPPLPVSPELLPSRGSAANSRQPSSSQLWNDVPPLPSALFPALSEEWWPGDDESLPPLSVRTGTTSRGSIRAISRGSGGLGTPFRTSASREGPPRSRDGLRSRERANRSRDGLSAGSRERARPSRSRDGIAARSGSSHGGRARRSKKTKGKQEQPIGASEAFSGVEARLDFFKLYGDDRSTHNKEGTAKPPNSARRVFLDCCYNSQTLPMPLLIAREAAANKQLDLNHYKMDDQLAVNFAAALPQLLAQGVQIESLLLGHNPIGVKGCIAVAGALGSCLHLRRLDLSGCDLSDNRDAQTNPTSVLGETLKNHPTIEALAVAKTRLSDRAATGLLHNFEAHRTLNELDMSGNSLGSAGLEFATAMAEFITNRPEPDFPALRKLSLGWNALRGAAAEVLAAALGSSDARVERLSLAWNNLGATGGAALGSALRTNTELLWLDLTHTELEERATMVIADAAKENTTLQTLLLNDNPIGQLGGRAILRAMISRREDKSRVQMPNLFRINGCTLLPPVVEPATTSLVPLRSDRHGTWNARSNRVADPTAQAQQDSDGAMSGPLTYASLNQATFDPCKPGGSWLCRLNNPYERAVANELVALAWAEDGENWQDEKLDGSPFEVPEPPDGSSWERANPRSFRLPEDAELQVMYRCTRLPPTLDDALHPEMMRALVSLLRETIMVQGPEAALAVLQLAEYELYFTAENVAFIVQLFEDSTQRAAAAAKLFHRIVDCVNWTVHLLDRLSEYELRLMQAQLGHLFHFVPTNPTGHYRLNLHNHYDHILMAKLVAISGAEARYRIENNMIDTSQNGGFGSMRNVRLDGRPYTIKHNDPSFLSTSGIVELDFVSTNLSDRFGCTPAMPDPVFKGLCFDLNRADFQFRVKKRKPSLDKETLLSLKAKWGADAMSDLDYALATHSSTKIQSRFRCYRHYSQHVSSACLHRIDRERRLRTDRNITLHDPRLAQVIKDAEAGKDVSFARIVVKMQARFRGKQIRAWMQRMQQSNRTYTAAEMNEMAEKARITHYEIRGRSRRFHRKCWHLPLPQAIEARSDAERQRHGARQRLSMLRRATSEFIFSTKQLRTLLTSGTVKKAAAVDLIVLAFSRLPDPENLETAVLSLLEPPQILQLRERLGWANLLNPFLVDGHHVFQFKYHDHRIVCAVIMQIAKEPGLNWRNETFSTENNPDQKSGMAVPASWAAELPRRDIFEADYVTEAHQADLQIRCPLARRLLLPGAGRWHCMATEQLQLDVSKTYFKHETDEIELNAIDGVHPDREGSQKCPVNSPSTVAVLKSGVVPTVDPAQRLFRTPVEAEEEPRQWAVRDDGILGRVPLDYEMRRWHIGRGHWRPGQIGVMLGHAGASNDSYDAGTGSDVVGSSPQGSEPS